MSSTYTGKKHGLFDGCTNVPNFFLIDLQGEPLSDRPRPIHLDDDLEGDVSKCGRIPSTEAAAIWERPSFLLV